MFGFLRMFLLLILITVLGASAYGVMIAHDMATEDLHKLVQDSNSNVGEGFIHTVWKKHRDVIMPLTTNPEQLKNNPQVVQFAQDTIRYFRKMPLMRVNIYSANGLLLITDNVNTITKMLGTAASPDKQFVVAQAKHIGSVSQTLESVALTGNVYGKLIQTIIPLRLDGAEAQPSEGVVELIFDISEPREKLFDFQLIAWGVIGLLVILFLAILTLTSRRAEAIIAKQHEANLELSQTAAAAQAENRDKSQFLANISHELRTPLNAIIGFSDIIKTELMPKVEERKYDQYVNDIHTAGVHLLSLINDILDFSKAEAGKLSLEVSEVDATKMIQNSMRLVMPRAEAGGVKLIDNLPKEHIIIKTDGKKFKQVLLNLLSNAVKFTPSGGEVTLTGWQPMGDDNVTFEVKDTGIGIAPKDISRAMSPFGQVDNTLKRKYEGTGLGLPLTKKFIELMGGKFAIESELDKGTKITFSLPRELTEREGVIVKQAS